MENTNLNDALLKVRNDALSGVGASIDDCLVLDSYLRNTLETSDNSYPLSSTLFEELRELSSTVMRKWKGKTLETCSIVNGRSEKCTEDCAWCAVSKRSKFQGGSYSVVTETAWEKAVDVARNSAIDRISLVTSGRKVSLEEIKNKFGKMFKLANGKISLCASMGLLGREELVELKKLGVTRYHSNLETSETFFPKLCSTHTQKEKLETIKLAKDLGFEICSGGIIGMGETMKDRLLMIKLARDVGASSVPMNILEPISHTPLEHVPLISEEEIFVSSIFMRLIHPKATIRFAGGRARLSKEIVENMLRSSVNGLMIGDLLTTHGASRESDFSMIKRIESEQLD